MGGSHRVKFKITKIWYGGDSKPDQWPKEIWHEDMRLFRLAHIDFATLPVFSWSLLQPEEERYEFGWLDEILHLLAKMGSTSPLPPRLPPIRPGWPRYPDVLRVDFIGESPSTACGTTRAPTVPHTVIIRPTGRASCRAVQRSSHLGSLAVSNQYGG